jgi:hypothetical protein
MAAAMRSAVPSSKVGSGEAETAASPRGACADGAVGEVMAGAAAVVGADDGAPTAGARPPAGAGIGAGAASAGTGG